MSLCNQLTCHFQATQSLYKHVTKYRTPFNPSSFPPLMRLTTRLASFLALWTALVQASDVVELDSFNFESVVNPEELILVEFFAPW